MIEVLYGLEVIDEEVYASYRAAMTPLLEAHGGRFVVDVRVAEVLRSPEGAPFNRLFAIRFPSPEKMSAFFANAEYLAVRRRLFEPSVSAVQKLGDYDVRSR
jgi:uncharacterized protein (DUF1330 family)